MSSHTVQQKKNYSYYSAVYRTCYFTCLMAGKDTYHCDRLKNVGAILGKLKVIYKCTVKVFPTLVFLPYGYSECKSGPTLNLLTAAHHVMWVVMMPWSYRLEPSFTFLRTALWGSSGICAWSTFTLHFHAPPWLPHTFTQCQFPILCGWFPHLCKLRPSCFHDI